MIVKKIERSSLPTRFNIYDSNWNRGIVIGNIIIFNSRSRKETKKIKTVYQYNSYTHAYYIKYTDEEKLYIIYIKEE